MKVIPIDSCKVSRQRRCHCCCNHLALPKDSKPRLPLVRVSAVHQTVCLALLPMTDLQNAPQEPTILRTLACLIAERPNMITCCTGVCPPNT